MEDIDSLLAILVAEVFIIYPICCLAAVLMFQPVGILAILGWGFVVLICANLGIGITAAGINDGGFGSSDW